MIFGRSEGAASPGAAEGGWSRRPLALVVVLAFSAALLAGLGPTLNRLPLAALAYTLWMGALLILVAQGTGRPDRLSVLLGGAVLLRLLFLPTLPDLSVDPLRYLWDGWAWSEGVNPYRFTPSDPEFVHRQGDLLFKEMNSRDFFSIYPPLSQWLFLPAGAVYETLGWPGAWLVLKGTLVGVEMAGVVALAWALRLWGIPLRFLALYAWNPLTVVVVAGVGHSEAGLILGLGLLALGLARAGPTLAWTGLGLAIISKGVPLVIAPLLFRHHLRRVGWRPALRATALGAVPAVLLSLPFLFPGLPSRILASAQLYVHLFQFNAGLAALVAAGLDLLPGAHRAAAGPLLRGLFVVAAVWVWLRHPVGEGRRVLEGSLLLMGLYLLAATTVHPWYLLWGLPLVPFVVRYRALWLWGAWAGFLTYFVYVGVSESMVAGIFWGGIAVAGTAEGWPQLRRRLLPLAGRRKARQIRSHLQGSRILDLGAGEGFVGDWLARGADRPLHLVLADVAPTFEVDRPAFIFDGRRTPLPDGAMDTVVLSLVLHHASEPDRLLREALRVARGRVVITESTYRWEWERRLLEWVDRGVNRDRGLTSENPRADREPHWSRASLHFDTVEGWATRIQAAGGELLVSRRLNRVGHRHHLFVVVPPGGESDPRGLEKEWGLPLSKSEKEVGAKSVRRGDTPTP